MVEHIEIVWAQVESTDCFCFAIVFDHKFSDASIGRHCLTKYCFLLTRITVHIVTDILLLQQLMLSKHLY